MRRNHRKDDIERNLKALDGIKDTRRKEDIYHNVQLKMKEPKSSVLRFRKPVVWGLSTAAVVVLTVIVISQGPDPASQEFSADQRLVEQEDETTSSVEEDPDTIPEEAEETEEVEETEETVEEEREDIPIEEEDDESPENETQGEDPSLEQRDEEDTEGEDPKEDESIDRRVEEMEEVYAHLEYRPAALQMEQTLLVLPFLAPDDETIVAVTVNHTGQTDEDEAETLLERINPSDLGLQDSPLMYMEEEEGSDEIIYESLSEMARFDTEQQWPSDWEERFQQESDEIEPSAGYYAFQADKGNAYLVSGRSLNMEDESLEETLQSMETEKERMDSVIPSHVELEDVDTFDDDSVLLSYSGLETLSEADETARLMFIEGVLLTAADFGYHDIEFEGDLEDVDNIGPYDLNDPIDPPVSPNYIGEVEE